MNFRGVRSLLRGATMSNAFWSLDIGIGYWDVPLQWLRAKKKILEDDSFMEQSAVLRTRLGGSSHFLSHSKWIISIVVGGRRRLNPLISGLGPLDWVTLWCHQTWLAGKSQKWMEVSRYQNHLFLWSIFQLAMFDDTGGYAMSLGMWLGNSK